MTAGGAHKAVLVAGGLMTSYVLLQGASDPAGRYRQLWAVGALTLGLSVAADFVPEIAGPFALLVLLAAATREANRGKLGGLIGRPASRQTTTKTAPPARKR